jgi:hypothetical protein
MLEPFQRRARAQHRVEGVAAADGLRPVVCDLAHELPDVAGPTMTQGMVEVPRHPLHAVPDLGPRGAVKTCSRAETRLPAMRRLSPQYSLLQALA